MKEVTVEKVIGILNAEGIEIGDDKVEENLIELGMDSIKFIQIIVSLEEAFDCEIPDSKLLIAEMDTVEKIYDVLQGLCDD